MAHKLYCYTHVCDVAMDPLVVIKGEGESVKSRPIINNRNPELNFKTIFYRKKLDQPITVEV